MNMTIIFASGVKPFFISFIQCIARRNCGKTDSKPESRARQRVFESAYD